MIGSRRYLLSGRRDGVQLAQGTVSECEDVLAQVLDAIVLAPSTAVEGELLLREVEPGSDLLVVALSVGQLVRSLRMTSGWRSRFARVWGYVFDSSLPEDDLLRPGWRRRLSRFSRTIASLDHLFVSCRAATDMVASRYRIPVSYLPLAADVLKFGTSQPQRPITVNGYGRQHPEHVKVLADAYNHAGSPRAFFYTSHVWGMKPADMARHRAFFWKMLSMSRIALAYDILRVKGGRNFPFSFVGQRWFESLAAGCAVVGFRPECAEADELLDWHDATIQCPEDAGEFLGFINELLEDQPRLDAVRILNHSRMAIAHDWAHRAQSMCQQLGLETTSSLEQRCRSLAALALRSAPAVRIDAVA